MARVLVVDDERSIRMTLQAFLRSAGHDTSVAEEAHEAVRMMESSPYDVVVTDIVLPGMTGVDLLKVIREAGPDVQVIMMTGEPTVETAAEAVRTGASDYLCKPIGKDAIIKIVAQAAKVKALNDEKRRLEAANREYQANLEKSNRQLAESLGKLRALEDLRDNLVHMIVHDIKNLVFVISGHLELLADSTGMGRDSGSDLSHAQNASYRLMDMAASLLDVSRMEQGQMPINKQECDLRALATEATDILRPRLEGRKTQVETVGASMVSCDADVIRRVLSNLLDNALKYSPPEGLIGVLIRNTGKEMEVRVSDQGPGIPPEFHLRIFEKFGRVEQKQAGKSYSTGLGLTFCKLAIEAHGGRIGLETGPAQGTTFWFTLPIDG